MLEGWEVKSMRAGKAQIAEGYVYLKNGEAFLFGALITPLNTTSTHVIADPKRTRKLLLSKAQLSRLLGSVEREGYTLVPLDLHWKDGPRQARNRPRQGQEAARQARHRERTRLEARQSQNPPTQLKRRARDSMYAPETSNGGDRFRRGLRTVRGVPRV